MHQSLSSTCGRGKHSWTSHTSWSDKVSIDLGIPTSLWGVSLGKLMRMTLKNCLFRRKIWPAGFQLVFFFFPPQRTGRDTREEKPGLKKKPGPYPHLPGSNLETRPMSSDNKALWHPVSWFLARCGQLVLCQGAQILGSDSDWLYELTCLSLGRGWVQAKSLQSCPIPCNPIDCSLPGSSVHGIFPGQNTG